MVLSLVLLCRNDQYPQGRPEPTALPPSFRRPVPGPVLRAGRIAVRIGFKDAKTVQG